MKKKWILSALIAFVLMIIVFIWNLFVNWGIKYFQVNFSIGMILPFVIAFIVATPFVFFILYFLGRHAELTKHAKQGTGVDVTVFEGLPNIPKGTVVQLLLGDTSVAINSRITKATASLTYSQIKDAGLFTETQLVEKSKNVAGRAVIGGLLLGNVGALIGGMSGIGNKQEVVHKSYFIINYVASSGEDKVLSFEIVGATMGLSNFEVNLKQRAGIPIQSPVPIENDIQL